MKTTEAAKHVSCCDFCHGCVDFRFDDGFEVVETGDGDFLKCPTCTGAKRATRRVLARNVRPGMRVWFSGSVWTVARIGDGACERPVYGTGGRGILGGVATVEVHLFSIREGFDLTLEERI